MLMQTERGIEYMCAWVASVCVYVKNNAVKEYMLK